MNRTWSESVWEQCLPIFNAITKHPFIMELANGSLDAERFNRYLGQDEVYIGNYGRQMFLLADRISNPEEREMFRLFAQSGIDGEKAMHQLLISRFGTESLPLIIMRIRNMLWIMILLRWLWLPCCRVCGFTTVWDCTSSVLQILKAILIESGLKNMAMKNLLRESMTWWNSLIDGRNGLPLRSAAV